MECSVGDVAWPGSMMIYPIRNKLQRVGGGEREKDIKKDRKKGKTALSPATHDFLSHVLENLEANGCELLFHNKVRKMIAK